MWVFVCVGVRITVMMLIIYGLAEETDAADLSHNVAQKHMQSFLVDVVA